MELPLQVSRIQQLFRVRKPTQTMPRKDQARNSIGSTTTNVQNQTGKELICFFKLQELLEIAIHNKSSRFLVVMNHITLLEHVRQLQLS